MDTQYPSAPLRTSRPVTRKPARHHSSGVVHVNTRHTSRFTVIGNHLAQHRELSLLAIGLAVHIQSLPTGTSVDIRTLTARFPESAARIAAALRELEAHGYFRRVRERGPDGRLRTRTYSCNQPGAGDQDPEPAAEAGPAAEPPAADPVPSTAPTTEPAPHSAEPPAAGAAPSAEPTAEPAAKPTERTRRAHRAARAGARTARGENPPPRRPRTPRQSPSRPQEARRAPGGVRVRLRARPAAPGGTPRPLRVPQPAFPAAVLLQTAADLLAGLRREEPRLMLSARDIEQLAPGVAAWLERDTSPEGVRHALTAHLPPEPLRRPAAFLAHRLTDALPPPSTKPIRTDPLQNCDLCDHAFRAAPGRCGACRTAPRTDASLI